MPYCSSGKLEDSLLTLDLSAFAENFLTEEECDHIVSLAEPRLQRSGVVNTDTGGSEVSEIRTSQGVFLERNEDPIIAGGWQRRLYGTW